MTSRLSPKRAAQNVIPMVAVCAVAAAALMLVLSGCTTETVYRDMAQEENWEGRLDAAVESFEGALSPSSSVTIAEFEEAYLQTYDMGPAAALYLLDTVENSGANDGSAMFTVLSACHNLHLSVDTLNEKQQELKIPAEEQYTPQAYVRCLRALLAEAPDRVNAICSGDAPVAQKVQELDAMGMTALPWLAERIEAGEAAWTVCFTDQRLDLTAQERLAWLSAREQAEQSGASIDALLSRDTAVSTDFDVSAWMDAHRTELSAIRESV